MSPTEPRLSNAKYAKTKPRRPRRYLATCCLLLLSGATIWFAAYSNAGHAAPQTKAGQKTKVTSASLTQSFTRSVAYISTAAKAADKKLVNAKNQRQQAFFAALKKTGRNFKALVADVKGKNDKKFFKTLDRTGQSVNELETAYRLSGIKDPKVGEGVKKLVGAFKAFRKNYGKEAVRKKKGGPVTAKEAEQYKALEEKYRKTLAELTKLKAKLAQSTAPGGKASLAQINSLINQLTSLLSPPAAKPGAAGQPAAAAPGGGGVSLALYIRLLLFEEDFVGSWYAISTYASLTDPKGYAAYNTIDTYAADIDSYVSTVDASFEYTSAEFWSYTESTSVEISESYEVSISESEITQSESYLEDLSLDVSVDEYDVTLGNEDAAFIDHDDDGVADTRDEDDDGDGTPDAKDADDDGDDIADFAEEDDDGDGAPDALDDDDDNDGVDDSDDKDDDGDGTPDDKEVADNDDDGTPDDKDADDDNDGTPDAKDEDDDGDGVDDAEDTDDDNDGVEDSEDADHDNDGDGTADGEDTDDDNDGTADAADADDDGDGSSDAAEEAEEEEVAEEEPAEEEPAEEEQEAEEEPAEEDPAEEEDPGNRAVLG